MALQTAACPTSDRRLDATDHFAPRHIGPTETDIHAMLQTVGRASLEELGAAAVPASIHLDGPLALPDALGERAALDRLRAYANANTPMRSCIGMGYHGTVTPGVILRNVLENPGWYTQYTPYQAEIAQGRLEALLNFQTMVADLTGLPLAGASLLDEATAAAEAMAMCFGAARGAKRGFFVADDCHPQTLAVLQTRAAGFGIDLIVGSPDALDTDAGAGGLCGALVQYPTTDGRIVDHAALAERLHGAGALLCVATDPMALVLLRPPGEFGADIAIGSTQRFGVPMGLGGPHAAFLATRESLARRMPGRVIGVSRRTPVARPPIAWRSRRASSTSAARRPRATSARRRRSSRSWPASTRSTTDPDGLRAIARRIHRHTIALVKGLERLGHDTLGSGPVFDTLRVRLRDGVRAETIHAAAVERGINLRPYADGTIGITLDETSDEQLLADLLAAFGATGDDARARPARRGRDRRSRSVRRVRAHVPVPRAPRLPCAPRRSGDAPLPVRAAGARSLARALDDPARLLHDEAERDDRDAPGDLAGVRCAPPLRAARAVGRVRGALRGARGLARGDHEAPGRLTAAERRCAG